MTEKYFGDKTIMANFSYRAINESGMTVSGVIEADSIGTAEGILASKGYIPSSPVTEDRGVRHQGILERLKGVGGRVSTRDLILFTKQFRSMLSGGISIIRILQTLELQTENPALRKIVSAISQDIKEGSTLSEAMGKHPKVFFPLYISLLTAGEVSGSVPDVMNRLIYIMDHEAKVKADIRSALQYPVIVLAFLGVAFFVLLTFVIPVFAKVFTAAKITLPLPTLIAVGLHHFLANWWPFLLVISAAIVAGLVYYFRTKEGKYQRDSALIRLPVLGPLFVKAAMSRFASIFAILQSSGVPIMKSMDILVDTIGNAAISRDFEYVRERIREGQGISTPLRSTKYFTPMVVDMIAVGEETGNIDDMLREITKHYDDEVEYAVKGLADALGPFLIIGLAAVVGFFALAIFMPMWDLTKLAKPH